VLQVVVMPPAETMREVEEFRRLHDPAFHRVAAHVPVLAPFDSDDAGLIVRFDQHPAPPAFDVTFAPAAAAGRALVVPVSDGAAPLDELRRRLAAALLPPLAESSPAAPSLRIGLFGGDAEIELARRAFGTRSGPRGFRVTEVTLLLEDERGLWHEVRRKRLPSGLNP
jgi:hypothetical protein